MNNDSGPREIESGGKMSLAFPIQRMPGKPFFSAAPLFFDDTGTLRYFVIRVRGDGDVLRTTVEDGLAEWMSHIGWNENQIINPSEWP